MDHFFLTRLNLSSFRSFTSFRIECDERPVVLTGPNGIGKTNILEAISFLSPGRGLRHAKLEEVVSKNAGATSMWAVAANIMHPEYGNINLGTGYEMHDGGRRVIKLDGEKVKNQAELAKYFCAIWQTPHMDGLFLEGGSERRKFLDRLVYNFDPNHASVVYSYEYVMRERAKLLQENPDPHWLSSLEAKMAEKCVSITAKRLKVLDLLQSEIIKTPAAFPKALLSLHGEVEECYSSHAAEDVELYLKKQWHDDRDIDRRTKRTQVGVHRSDFGAFYEDKHMPASSCSTGEQKALVLSIILAHARARQQFSGGVPVMLLDEVVSHLDENRRGALFTALLDLGGQVWMTGTDTSLFEGLNDNAQYVDIAAMLNS